MKIIYAGIRREAYYSETINSFEYNNFYQSLKTMPEVEVTEFPFDRILKIGKRQFNQELLDLVIQEKPDLFFAFMYTDELEPAVLEKIKKHTVSVAWFSDDHWRFHNYSRFWTPHFSWIATTYSKAVQWYQALGFQNIIRSQWAANTGLYKPIFREQGLGNRDQIPVSFVGGWNYPRSKIIKKLKKRNVPIFEFGSGWPSGRIAHEKMLDIFSNSKINLALNPAQGFWHKNSLGRLLFHRSLDKIVFDFHPYRNLQSFVRRGIKQIKARHFEIPACGGFTISSMADDLDTYYKIGEEMVVYDSVGDLIDKINYYLKHDSERENIAKAGYERTIREHTYEKRFKEIFKTIGLNY